MQIENEESTHFHSLFHNFICIYLFNNRIRSLLVRKKIFEYVCKQVRILVYDGFST